jgi:hypothetical protein
MPPPFILCTVYVETKDRSEKTILVLVMKEKRRRCCIHAEQPNGEQSSAFIAYVMAILFSSSGFKQAKRRLSPRLSLERPAERRHMPNKSKVAELSSG